MTIALNFALREIQYKEHLELRSFSFSILAHLERGIKVCVCQTFDAHELGMHTPTQEPIAQCQEIICETLKERFLRVVKNKSQESH